MTSANRIGVTSGTAISRGVWAERAKRRRANVAKARHRPLRRPASGPGRAAGPEAGGPEVDGPAVVIEAMAVISCRER